MPTPRRTIRVCASVTLLAGLAACALPPSSDSPEGPFRQVIGQVRGQVEQGSQDVSVIQMYAIDSTRLRLDRGDAPPIVIRRRGQEPRIASVRPNKPVQFQNHDEIFHEIFSIEPDNVFKTRLAGGAKSEPIFFRTQGLVRAYCSLHPEENFAVLVTAADHLAYVEGHSVFQIPSVPVGEYRIVATGLDGASERKGLRVGAGQTVEVTLRLEQAEGS